MYSLYRAWLMRDAVTAASWTTPPDLIITVGNLGTNICEETIGYGYQFAAHKQLVSMHSGYLKSLVQNESLNTCGMSITNITLSNISSEIFALLLSFMYTGYLDLTNDNICSVLLATHLLHMPRALDLCRAFLVRNQSAFHHSPTESSHSLFLQNQSKQNLVKPIPSRKIQNFGQSNWSPISAPQVIFHTRSDGPFKCILPSDHREAAFDLFNLTEQKSSLVVQPSTSQTCKGGSSKFSAISSECSSNQNFEGDNTIMDVVKPQNSKKVQRKRESFGKTVKKINNENLKVEFDVASCDGPVRFHRVVNENYGMDFKKIRYHGDLSEMNDELEKIAEKEYLENYPKTQFLKLKCSNFTNFMHQQMIDSHSFKKPKCQNQTKRIVKKDLSRERSHFRPERENNKSENSNRGFICIYCKHTFKSQYCYQKHARRHINTILEDGCDVDCDPKTKGAMILRQMSPETNNRSKGQKENFCPEVRIFDKNVQYYPCKTCGSKFPSYYFVHKHRKLCHINEYNSDGNSDLDQENGDSSSSGRVSKPETLSNR